jgi:hypothetical protein
MAGMAATQRRVTLITESHLIEVGVPWPEDSILTVEEVRVILEQVDGVASVTHQDDRFWIVIANKFFSPNQVSEDVKWVLKRTLDGEEVFPAPFVRVGIEPCSNLSREVVLVTNRRHFRQQLLSNLTDKLGARSAQYVDAGYNIKLTFDEVPSLDDTFIERAIKCVNQFCVGGEVLQN